MTPIIGKKQLQKVDVPTLNTPYRHLLTAGRRKADNNTRMYAYWQAGQEAGRTPKTLVARPEATVAAYCAAVGLSFNPRAHTWEGGERSEWRRSARGMWT